MKLFWPKALFGFLALLVGLTIFAWFVLLRPIAQEAAGSDVIAFNHGSIGNEQRQGLPYWIWRVLPQMFPEYLPARGDGYGAFGLYWVAGEEIPVGFSKKTLGVIPRVAPNCAFCHQGSYRLYADDPPTLVPGGPGTRVDPQSYLRFLARVGQDERFNGAAVVEAITAIYDMPWWERSLYRFLLIPLTKSGMKAQGDLYAWTETRPDWGPGRIDPFNPVKFDNLKINDDGTIGNSDMMPLWGFGQVMGDGSRTTAFHWDGLNTDLGEVVLSGAIGDGLIQSSYAGAKDHLAWVKTWIAGQQAPSSPFSERKAADDPYHLSGDQVAAGRQLYAAHCAQCHEPGAARFRTVIPIAEVGTDRHRLDMWSPQSVERYHAYEEGYDWGFRAFQDQEGYVATELSGLWLKGPYLHNGSVPTLRDLLLPAEQRPTDFYRGWDLIDPVNGGFLSTPGGLAERYGWRYDTMLPGNSNAGHLFGTDLSPADKESLLSYLKTL